MPTQDTRESAASEDKGAQPCSTASILFWEFFGRSARPTADHFLRHLQTFLERNKITAIGSGVQKEAEMHCAVYCELSDATQAHAVAQTLRASPRSRLGPSPSASTPISKSEAQESHPEPI